MKLKVFPAEAQAALHALDSDQARWWRLLCFEDDQLEADFTQEFREARRPVALITMFCMVFYGFFEFFMSNGVSMILDTRMAIMVMYRSRIASLSVVTVVTVKSVLRRMDIETATLICCTSIPLSLIFGNLYRMTKVFGGDMHKEFIAQCDTDLCWDDTAMILGMTACTCACVVLGAVRASRSWIIVVLTLLLYLLANSFGLRPAPVDQVVRIGMMYFLIIVVLWQRQYAQERHHRSRWLETRRLRLQVEEQAQVQEAQQRWLRSVNERLEALQCRDAPTPSPSTVVAIETADATQVVPRPERSHDLGPRLAAAAGPCGRAEPNSALVQHMSGRSSDREAVRQIASRLRQADYGMWQYYSDCVAAFPELELFYVEATSSVRSGHVEYQRTFGALFAVYWLLRLDIDGKFGFSFGCDENWTIRRTAEGTDAQKKQDFFDNMDWALLRQVADMAMGGSAERVEAMLCLTAFHDVMKVTALTPRVSHAHAPYQAYKSGDSINDHDVALAYVLEHYPHLVPSFAALPEGLREVVLFSQTKIGFNHGWFVQAEGPPGAMLSSLRQVLRTASGADLAFYFVHWLTDVSGAEGTPLAGAEKFTRKFPHAVLVSFLWSMPYLQRLTAQPETDVVESYLEARFRQAFPRDPVPEGAESVALLRLAVMAQCSARLAVDAFRMSPPAVRKVLSEEMALTGIAGQTFRRNPVRGGPAFLIYYGPAVVQRCSMQTDMMKALSGLAAVYAAGRRLWRRDPSRSGETVTLEVGRLSCMDIGAAVDGSATTGLRIWVLVRQNDKEARLTLVSAVEMNGLVRDHVDFACVDLHHSDPISLDDMSEGTIV